MNKRYRENQESRKERQKEETKISRPAGQHAERAKGLRSTSESDAMGQEMIVMAVEI